MNDADIEMAQLQQLAAEADAAHNAATVTPTEQHLKDVEQAAYDAAYYGHSATEAAVVVCGDLAISPHHPKVQEAIFRGAKAAADAD